MIGCFLVKWHSAVTHRSSHWMPRKTQWKYLQLEQTRLDQLLSEPTMNGSPICSVTRWDSWRQNQIIFIDSHASEYTVIVGITCHMEPAVSHGSGICKHLVPDRLRNNDHNYMANTNVGERGGSGDDLTNWSLSKHAQVLSPLHGAAPRFQTLQSFDRFSTR